MEKDRISTNITYNEATISQTSARLKIDNTPTPEILANMKLVANKCFEPAREHFGPITISSFYRNYDLNAAVGGVNKIGSISQHTKGQAIDMSIGGPHSDKNVELLEWCKTNLEYDQLLNEFPDEKGRPCWVHCSYRGDGKNRKQYLVIK